MQLVKIFLEAPQEQLARQVVDFAATWRKPMPTIEQCDETLKIMDKYHASTLARTVMLTIRQEVIEAQQDNVSCK